MTILEAHERLCRMQVNQEMGRWPLHPDSLGDITAPLAMSGLVILSGGLDDATDDASLVDLANEAFALLDIAHGHEEWCDAMDAVTAALDAAHGRDAAYEDN